MKRFAFVAIILIVSLSGCKKDEITITSANESLAGIWIKPYYTDTLITFERAKTLTENEYGIVFYSDSKLIERKNNSFCGTPPITTSDYSGTWSVNDSLVNISVGYWGGNAEYKWRIKSITVSRLTVSVVEQKYINGK